MDINLVGFGCILVFFATAIPGTVGDCETGWVNYGDTCYYINQVRYNRHDSEKFCSQRNASIWIYHSNDEKVWMSKLLSEGPRILYWIGLQVVNRRWTFDDGTAYNKNNLDWYQNKEGSTTNGQNCGAMLSYKPYVGMTQQKRCNEGWGMVCTRPKAMLDFCDKVDGWHLINGRCLKMFDNPLPWFDARKTCQRNNGDLMIFKDWDANRELDSLIGCRTKENNVWIGLSDTVQPRHWRWINNDTLRYQRWVSYANRILVNGSTCAAASAIDNWSWRNYPCDTQNKFVCNRTIGVCPTGWLQYLDRCYQPNIVSSYKKTWFDAQDFCRSQGTSLLIINSEKEQNFINSTMKGLKMDRGWLGFSDEDSADSLRWLDGRTVTDAPNYNHFDVNFPNPVPNRYDCGLIIAGQQDSKWSNAYCFNMNAYFCEMKVTGTPITPTPDAVTNKCDKDWSLFQDHCYYFGPVGNQSTKTWNNARDYCSSSGGNLVIIGDPYEMSYITVQQSAIVNAWIGLKYDVNKQGLVWVDGSPPGQYWVSETNFYPGEPDDVKHGQLCIEIIGGRQDYTGAWDDANCSTAQGFICEKIASPASPPVHTGPPVPTISAYLSAQCGGPQWIYNSNDNFCYQVVMNQPKTWTAARADCVQRGGNLLSITGRREQGFVQAMLSTGDLAHMQLNMWIGATDQTQEGGWHWTDNSPFRFLNWHAGEPNNQALGLLPEDCAEMVPSWNYQWNDKKCAKEQNYICKKQTMSPTPPATAAPEKGLNGPCNGVAMLSGNYSVVDVSAFSSTDPRNVQSRPEFSRLTTGGWSAKTSDPRQYLSVQFYGTIVVKGIQTGGRTDTDEWVTQFKIQYQESYYAKWITYQNPPGFDMIFNGSTDASTVVTNMLMFPFEAKLVKLVPIQWHNGISVRWEILGCRQESCFPDYAISGPLVVNDSSITSSNIYDVAHDAKSSRLRPITPGVTPSCWKPQTSDTNQWIEVNLGNVMILKGITTKGNPLAQEWVTQYKFGYRLKAGQTMHYYVEPYNIVKKIPGNTDNTSPSTYYFKSHFQASVIRIIPVGWNSAIALAFDVLVCQNGCEGKALVSGTMHISDNQLNASTILDNQHSVFRARLNLPANGAYAGAWIPKFSDTHQYIQADLGYPVHIKAVATQGAYDSSDWVKTYQISYSGDGISWNSYFELGNKPKVFDGNWENRIARKQNMLIPFIARYVRLWPQTWNNRIAVRWELYGCPGSNSGLMIGCYSDDTHDRDLPYEPFTDPRVGMWPPMCIDHCFRQGYYYAGLQGQFKCFCGNTYGRYGQASNCTLQCMPKTKFFCGGPSSNIIYTTGLTPQFKVCPNNWKGFGGRCYILLLDKKGWYDARADCKMEGADLASPNSAAEQNFVDYLLGFGNGGDAWIGFNDIQDESMFNWADGRQVSYTNWGLGQPNHVLNANQDCVLQQTGGTGWRADACDAVHMYVCQMDKRSSSMPTQPPRVAGCPPDWDGYRWSCYLYADAKRTWRDSKAVCYSLGGSIVRLDDSYEQAYISSVLGNRQGLYWTDVTDTAQPGTYQHTLGQSYVTYTNWAQNKPDGTNQCVALASGNVSGLWYNWACNMKFGVICEKARLGYTIPPLPPISTAVAPCDPGLIQTDSTCYQLNIVTGAYQKSWTDALSDCTAKGGNLASFHSAAIIDFVWRQGLVGHGYMYFWIGLNDRALENGYMWSDKTPVQALNWADKEPNNYHGNEDCVEMSANTGRWNDENCNSHRNWICAIQRGGSFKVPTTIAAPTAGDSRQCGVNSNWSYYGNYCYYANDGNGDNGKSWRQARVYCQQNGGDLASIHDQQEELFIYRTLTKNISANGLWIGYNELDSNTGYRWSDKTPDRYRNWATNEPNDYGGAEDCVNMHVNDGTWNDEHCSHRFGFVCKRRVGSLPTPPLPTAPWAGNCPSGFTLLNNRCYRIYTMAVNWTTALANCKALGPGYNLASVRSDVENAFLVTQLADMHVNPWIGMQKDWSNTVQWINNDDVTYTNFAHGEPNGKQREKCVQMLTYKGRVGQWNDNRCSSQLPYICMVNKDRTITTPEPIPSICDSRQQQTQFVTGCYFYVSQSLSWTDANNKCISQGGYLSSINSAFEEAFVYLTMKQNKADIIWTGLNDRTLSGTYSWADGWPVVYSNWDDGQPGSIKGCVMINSTGKWSDVNCTNIYPSICKISKVRPSLTPPPPGGTCDLGWYPYHGKCYYYGLNTPLSALDASIYCHQRQSALVSVHNLTVDTFLSNTIGSLTNSKGGSFWTGLHKSLDSGWQWLDNTPVQLTNWRPGEPSVTWGGRIENCMEVFISDGKWNDEDCNSKRMFVCEKQMAVDTSNQHIGTGGMPVRVPTPNISVTRPAILPPQEVPTLIPGKGTVLTTQRQFPSIPSPTVSQITPKRLSQPSTVSPRFPPGTFPKITGGVSTNTPTGSSKTLGATGVTDASKGSSPGSLSTGAIAGVAVGSVIAVLLIVFIVLLVRRFKSTGHMPRFGFGNEGFENKTYGYDNPNNDVTESSINGVSLRSMSESSS